MGDKGSEQPPGQTQPAGGDKKMKPLPHLPNASRPISYGEGKPPVRIGSDGRILGPFPVPMEDSDGNPAGQTIAFGEMSLHTLDERARPHGGETAVPPEIAGLGDEPEPDK